MIILGDAFIFLEIVESGHFAGAARKLGVAKSNVARQLDRLETELGVRLFARTTRSLSLTDEGQAFLPYARRLVDDSREAASVVQTRKGLGSGLLKVSSPSTFGRWFLAPHLASFRRRHPDVRVALDLTARKVELGPDGADIALRLGPLIDPGLSVRRLGAIEFCLVASPAYLRKRRAPKVPQDVRDHAFAALRPPVGERRIELQRGRETVSVAIVPVVECNDPDVVLTVCLDGGGLAALPRFLVAEQLKTQALKIALPGWAPHAAEILVVFSAQTAPPLRVKAFIDHLFDTLGESRPWEKGLGAPPPGVEGVTTLEPLQVPCQPIARQARRQRPNRRRRPRRRAGRERLQTLPSGIRENHGEAGGLRFARHDDPWAGQDISA